jgi:hypothetical protein
VIVLQERLTVEHKDVVHPRPYGIFVGW